MNRRKEEEKSSDFRLLGLALLFILFTIGQGFGQPFDPTAWNPDDGWDQIPEIQMPETQDPFNFVQEFETTNFGQENNPIRYPETPIQPQNKDANTYDVNLDGTTISHETIPGSDRWGVQIEKDYGSTQLSGTIWVIVGGGLPPSIPLGWVGPNIAIGDKVNIGGRYDPEMHSVTLYGNAGYYMRLLSKQPTPNPEPNPEPYPEPNPEPYPKPNPEPIPEPIPVNQPPSVLELIPNKGSPQSIGSTVDWTATASDPDSGDTIYYKFMINNAATNSQWQDMTVWSTSNAWTWSPTGSDLGENYIGVAVRDGNHAAEDDYDDFKQMAYTISQENQPPKITNIYSDLTSPQKVGSTIVWTAEASDPDNGDAIYYKFRINNNATNGQWQDMTGWSDSNTWTWSPTSSDIGKNSIGVFARDGKHAPEDDYDSYLGDYFDIIQDNQPPKVTNIYPDQVSPQKVGSTIIWTASATDPDSSDTIYYKFMIKNNATNEQWQETRGWSDSNTWTWSPTSSDIGKNSIGVFARDGKHAPEDDYDSYLGDYFDIGEDNQPPKLNGIKADPTSPQKVGTPITWTAEASDTDPGDTIYYKFMLSGHGTNNQYQDMTGWITTSTWTWNPSSADEGRNSIDVLIRDGKHAPESDHDANLEAYFDIAKENQPPTVTSLTPDQASPQKAGATIIWTAKASDPENDTLQYQFTLDGKVVADWSNSDKWSWSSSEGDIGSKKIGVAVKDGNHAIADNSDDIQYASFDITASQTPQPVSLTIVRGRVIKIPECQPSKNGESCYFGIRILEVISNPMNLPTIAINKTISIHYNSDSQSMTPLNINDCVEIAARWDGDLYCSPEYSGEHVTKIDCPEGMPRCDDPWNPNLKPGIKCVDNTIYKEIIYPDCTRQWMIYDDCNKYDPPRQCIDGKCVEGNGCEPGFTGIRKCQDDKVIGLYKNADCSEEWKIEDDCSKYTPPRICENGKCVLQSQCKNDEHPPELYDPRVTPDCGKKNSTFNFSVIYKDEDGDLPSVANIWIRGFEFGGTRRVYDDGYYHDMLPLSDNEDITKGAKYYYSVELPADGEYYYWIYFTNTKGCRVDLPSDSASSETLGLIGPKVKDDCGEGECENALKFKGRITEIIPPATPDSSSGVEPCIFNISVSDPSIDTKYIIAKSWEGCKGLEIGKCVEVYGCSYVVGFPENRWGVDIKGEPYYITEVPCSTEYVDIKFNGTAIKFHKGEMPGAPDYWTVKVDQPIISGPQPCSEQLDVVTYQAIGVIQGHVDDIKEGDYVEVYGQYRLETKDDCDVTIYGLKEYYIKIAEPRCKEIKFQGTCLEVKDMCWGSEAHKICPYWVVRAEIGEIELGDITVYAGLPTTLGDYNPSIAAGNKVDVFGCLNGSNLSIMGKESYYIRIISPEEKKSQIRISATINPEYGEPGSEINIEFTIKNIGNSILNTVCASITFPSDLKYISDDSDAKPIGTGNEIMSWCKLGPLAPNELRIIHIIAKIDDNAFKESTIPFYGYGIDQDNKEVTDKIALNYIFGGAKDIEFRGECLDYKIIGSNNIWTVKISDSEIVQVYCTGGSLGYYDKGIEKNDNVYGFGSYNYKDSAISLNENKNYYIKLIGECDPIICQLQNTIFDGPLTKEGKSYLKYRNCDCSDKKCKCLETEEEVTGRKVLEGVPSQYQGGSNWCAWVSAQMALEYYGYHATPEEIGKRTYELSGDQWEGENSGFKGSQYPAFEKAIGEFSQGTLEIKWHTFTEGDDKDAALRVIIDAINNDMPILIEADLDWTGLPMDNPDIGHVSVLVGYSLNDKEGLVKELPFLGVLPPSIRFHDPALSLVSGGMGFGTYWINYYDVIARTIKDGNSLGLGVVKRK